MPPTSLKAAATLLSLEEDAAFQVVGESARSRFVLVCDHASWKIPRSMRSLGLDSPTLMTHIGWDIGAAEVARILAGLLDAVLIVQNYSRLVIDCNRPPGSAASIVKMSDGIAIPGNEAVSPEEARQRTEEIFMPYHERIRSELDSRGREQEPPVLVSVHSFTPIMQGVPRPWHAGTLYNRDARLARALMRELRTDPALTIGDNEPYAASDATDYAIPHHGERRGLLHVGIEIRQDLIANRAGQQAWAERLSGALSRALSSLTPAGSALPGATHS